MSCKLGKFDEKGNYVCPAGYLSVILPNAQRCCVLGKDITDDMIIDAGSLPEVLVTSSKVETPVNPEIPSKPSGTWTAWIKKNWYWIVMPFVLSLVYYAYSKFSQRKRVAARATATTPK